MTNLVRAPLRRRLLFGITASFFATELARGKAKAPLACSVELPGGTLEYLLPAELVGALIPRESNVYFDPEKLQQQKTKNGEETYEVLTSINFEIGGGRFSDAAGALEFFIDVFRPMTKYGGPIETAEELHEYLRWWGFLRGKNVRIADSIGTRAVIVGDPYYQTICIPLNREFFFRVTLRAVRITGRANGGWWKLSTGWIDAIRSSMKFRRRSEDSSGNDSGT